MVVWRKGIRKSFFKYLGVTLSMDGKWIKHGEDAQVRWNNSMRAILNTISQFPDLNFETLVKIYRTKMFPVLSYGSEIWGLEIGNKFNHLKHNFWD